MRHQAGFVGNIVEAVERIGVGAKAIDPVGYNQRGSAGITGGTHVIAHDFLRCFAFFRPVLAQSSDLPYQCARS